MGPAARAPLVSSRAATGDPVIVAAGDIACPPGTAVSATNCHQGATSNLLAGATAVLTLGDAQYPAASLADFQAVFHPTWGRFKAITHPTSGNHEYNTAGAAGYYDYFGAAAGPRGKGYYSYDLGAWHLIAINSNCTQVGGCNAGSAQERWLRADLAASAARCTLAYWHHPLFSSGTHGSDPRTAPLWQALYEHGADVVLTGHDHNYQRFAPQTASGVADPRGIREFVVGTGGRGHYAVNTPIANQEVAKTGTFGVLKLTLHALSYDWAFVPESGAAFTDSGSASCAADQNRPPVISSNGAGAAAVVSVEKGQTAVTDVDATDADGDTVTYAIGGGADAASFVIAAATGVLTFRTPHDPANPTDSDRDSVYEVTVRASDGRLTDTQALAVTVTAVGESAAGSLYLTLRSAATVSGVSATNEDVLFTDGASFSLAFDGSDVGLSALRIDAFSWLDADSLVFSFDTPGSVPGIVGTVDDSDVVRFDANSLGARTSGVFSLLVDASDLGLSADAHDLDAVEMLPDGSLLLSTTGALGVAGVNAADADLVRFVPTSLGGLTAGRLSLYFDGSDIGLTATGEDVDAAAVDSSGRIYLSTVDAFSVTGVSGQDEDVVVFQPSTLGPTTSGTFLRALAFDGSVFGLAANDVFAVDVP
jgi:hypothetical protein